MPVQVFRLAMEYKFNQFYTWLAGWHSSRSCIEKRVQRAVVNLESTETDSRVNANFCLIDSSISGNCNALYALVGRSHSRNVIWYGIG